MGFETKPPEQPKQNDERKCCDERRWEKTVKNRGVGLGPVQCDGIVFVDSGAVASCVAKLPEFSQKGNPQKRMQCPFLI